MALPKPNPHTPPSPIFSPLPETPAHGLMLIAGEPSGDLLAAELVHSLRRLALDQHRPPFHFFGAGGPHMAQAGVTLELDLTRFAVIGLADVLRQLWNFRRMLHRLVDLAVERQPEVIVCVDYGGFNRRFAAALRQRTFPRRQPRLVQYVSPQVWASRAGRARTLARDLDLLISILPHEKAWYAARHPQLRVDYVGHPIVDRHPKARLPHPHALSDAPRILLLPGSRPSEIRRHWPLMVETAQATPFPGVQWIAVFVSEESRQTALRAQSATDLNLETQVGGLPEQLARATLAVASTGTVTLECALWQVPTLALYRASWSTYQIARRIIRVPHLAMPNLLAPKPVMAEFLQHQASPAILSQALLDLLQHPAKLQELRHGLAQFVELLGPPGGSTRAAEAVLSLLPSSPPRFPPG